jgi:capsular exopolysaccharide synthesis family protein
LQFLQGKVFQVTSSIHEEGKSFIYVNLALSLAYMGKKVLLVGLDLRKPTLSKYFSEIKFEDKNSVVGYLNSQTENLDAIPVKCDIHPNLDLLLSGRIPPNPMTLLSSSKFEGMMDYYKTKYDYIICDSTPYFAVSDAMVVNKYVDHTLYVIRADYTDMRSLPDIEKIIKERKLKNVNVIFNSLDMESAKYRYGYGYGYGYGHYGYGYSEEENKKKGLMRRIIKRLKKNNEDDSNDSTI